jgi:hypothetical protein
MMPCPASTIIVFKTFCFPSFLEIKENKKGVSETKRITKMVFFIITDITLYCEILYQPSQMFGVVTETRSWKELFLFNPYEATAQI